MGGNGTDLDGVNGSGGGGCGVTSFFGRAGGNYGGGGGAIRSTYSCTGGAGIQGIILVTYTPGVANPVFATNLAMMGL